MALILRQIIIKSLEVIWEGFKTKNPLYHISKEGFKYSERDLNPHGHNGHWILSPTCLPIPPPELLDLHSKKNSTLGD